MINYLHRTLCIDPRVEPSSSRTVNGGDHVGQYGVPAAYERSFKWKVGYFRNLCAVSQRKSMLNILPMTMITSNPGQQASTAHCNPYLKRERVSRFV